MTSLTDVVDDPTLTEQLTDQVESLVRRCARLPDADLSLEARRHIALVVADTVGVVVAGAQVPEMRRLVANLCGDDESTGRVRLLDGGARRLDAATASWLHGTAGTFLELDEGIRPTGHPGIHLIPAALAVAEEIGASGARLLAAVAAGYEVTARLHQAFVLPGAMHPHGHFGVVGAATAVAMLRGVDAVDVARIAATQPLLTGWVACMEGATARNAWAGHTNRVGVQSELLHRAGFRGSFGSYLSVIGAFLSNAEVLSAPVEGTSLEINQNYFKMHSVCALGQTAVDAALEARRRLDFDPTSVELIEVETLAANLRIAGPAEPNSLSTRFSLPYAVAAATLHGRADPMTMEWASETARFANRVRISHAPEFDADWPAQAAARVKLHQAVGPPNEVTVHNPHGHHESPVSSHELRTKFVDLLTRSGFDRGHNGRVFDALVRLGDIADCSQLPLPARSAGSRTHHMETE